MASVETPLPYGLGASQIARASLRNTLGLWHLERLADVAALLASELVSNAVLHAGGPSTMRVSRSRTALRIEVEYVSVAPPELHHADHIAEHGRGIFLVTTMSSDWGYEVHVHGKTVWFELELPVVLGQVHRNGSS
jgi:anti-sigma regulatory factor (Ser/Thr protein kinase)